MDLWTWFCKLGEGGFWVWYGMVWISCETFAEIKRGEREREREGGVK